MLLLETPTMMDNGLLGKKYGGKKNPLPKILVTHNFQIFINNKK